METIVVKARKWGNSIGVALPKKVVQSEGIKEGQEVTLTIFRESSVF